ncbi:MAG: choice-of-anchor G family protein [Oscillospiraceae bacterium]|nr:choice-of-anchor G family protein [Oscillospiraceae bacterium]
MSNAAAQFVSGSVLGATPLKASLFAAASIGGASAHYEDGVTAGTDDTVSAAFDTGVLDGASLNVGGSPLPLSDILTLGAANQYAQASQGGVSRAMTGAVGNDGTPSADFPAGATFNLMKIIPETPALSAAALTIGAVNGGAQWDAAQGNVLAAATDAANPSQGRGYSLASAALELTSPAIGAMADTFNTALEALGTAVSALGSQVITGLTNGVADSLDVLSTLTGGLNIGANTLTATVGLDPSVIPDFSTPVSTPDKAVTLVMTDGSLSADLGTLLGGTLNGLPPNTELISTATMNKLGSDFAAVADSLRLQMGEVMAAMLDDALVSVSGHITLMEVLTVDTGLDISYTGTLEDLLRGTQSLSVSGTGALALLGGAADTVIGLMQTALVTVLTPLITGILSDAGNTVGAAVTTMEGLLSPVFALFSGVMSCNINVQQDGDNTFGEIPLQFTFLGDGAVLNLGLAQVGPNTVPA